MVLFFFPIKQVVWPYVECVVLPAVSKESGTNLDFICCYPKVCNCWVLLFICSTTADNSTCSRNATIKRGRYSIEKVFYYSL